MRPFTRVGKKAALLAAIFLCMGAVSYQEVYLKGLWARIHPSSLRDLLCFFHLYPGNSAYNNKNLKEFLGISLSENSFKQVQESLLISIVDMPKEKKEALVPLDPLTLEWIKKRAEEKLEPRSNYLCVESLDELLKVDPSKWDLAQVAWIASAYPKLNKASAQEMEQYLARIDLLALSVVFAIEQEPVEKERLAQAQIEKLNQIIFQEQGFEFPPLLDHESQIDKYTSVPSMLSSKRGVCLGASVLYLAIAQRLGLKLDIVTPPGHIYLSYLLPEGYRRNIETTASGMDLPEEIYRPLQKNRLVYRDLKELPGLILMNTASVLLGNQQFAEASKIYDKAIAFFNKETSFFISEFNAVCQWLSNYPGALQNAGLLLKEYRGLNQERLITWDPLLLEEIVGQVIGQEPVKLALSSVIEEPASYQKLLLELGRLSNMYPRSKWLKSQMAITAWKLNQEARAYFLWPFGASSSSSFLWLGAQLSMQVGQLDRAMTCMNELSKKLSAEDTAPMTPFRLMYVQLCEEAILNKN